MMLAVLFAVAIAPADSLRFVISGRDSAIPVRAEGQASFVGAEAAAGALGGRVQRLPNHRFLVSIAGVAFELADRVPFALSDGRLYPLVHFTHLETENNLPAFVVKTEWKQFES